MGILFGSIVSVGLVPNDYALLVMLSWTALALGFVAITILRDKKQANGH